MGSSTDRLSLRIGCIGKFDEGYLAFDGALLVAKDEDSLRHWAAHLGLEAPDECEFICAEISLDIIFAELCPLHLDSESFTRFSPHIIHYCEYSMRPQITESEMGVLIEPVPEGYEI